MIIGYQKRSLKNNSSGDTIVEVLIAIAIASFAIGISYATAERSLQQAVAAREQNQALNLLQSQIADLSLRFRVDQVQFDTKFASDDNFCLGDSARAKTDMGWIYQNNSPIYDSTPLTLTTSGGKYNFGCQNPTGGANYFINITTANHGAAPNSTLYNLTARWYRLGSGLNKASLYFKLNQYP